MAINMSSREVYKRVPKRRTVLIAMDGSENSLYAFNWYVSHLHQENDYIFIVISMELNELLNSHCWHNAFSPSLPFNKDVFMGILDSETKVIKEKLEYFASLLLKSGVKGTVKGIHASKPGEGIINAAAEVNADFIITGSRGRGTLCRTMLGSVSDYVLHHSKVPVIICRQREHPHI